ncbi:excalibur calcium-binding domain-containing protein, partial [Nocardia sp. NPDC002869]|uniref:excalibur calcium-binding domain-containing protein n=1 Tax=Nocardia sp. NPDC002869 TaxID=3161032 RepID=UPI00398C9582
NALFLPGAITSAFDRHPFRARRPGSPRSALAAAPAAADTPLLSNRSQDSHPLPADRAEAEPEKDGQPYYLDCAHARRESDTPLLGGRPGYSRQLDADGDGVACEVGE